MMTTPRSSPDSLPVRLAVTLGDPAGIGPEIVSRVLCRGIEAGVLVRVYGDPDALGRSGGLPDSVELEPHASASVVAGRPDADAAKGVVDAIRAAAGACLDGRADAVVTGPISKRVIGDAGYPYPGHTELLQEIAGSGNAMMLLCGGRLRTALATIHCALREVPARLARVDLSRLLVDLDSDLRRRFALPAPRIAVCGLNPHAGEDGRFGDEEQTTIAPAIRTAVAHGVCATGPHPADTVFHRAVRGDFDCVLGMYHDQALGPLKLHAFGRAANVTLGLPLVRTSVDHGTAFDIAGRGVADPGSLEEAIRLAAELVRNERSADEGERQF